MSKKNTNLENKTERANRIAEQSKKVKRTYEKMEESSFLSKSKKLYVNLNTKNKP